MKYFNSLLLIAIITLTFSCNKEVDTNHSIEIKNYSSNKIEIPTPDTGDVENITILQPNKSYKYNFSERGNQPKFSGFIHGFLRDSAKIIFNDTLTIYHGSKQYNVARDIKMVNSYVYEGGDRSHQYTYTFTNEDFREADSIIN